MKQWKNRFKFIVYMWLLLFATGLTASSAFEGNRPNVWVIDNETGMTISTFSFDEGDWSILASQGSITEARIFLEGGSDVLADRLDLTRQSVIVNELNASLSGTDAGIPSVSVSGIDAGLLSEDSIPVITISPAGGVYDETIQVRLKAVSARGLVPQNYPVTFFWKINGGAWKQKMIIYSEETGFENDFYLAQNGSYSIDCYAVQDNVESTPKTAGFTIEALNPGRDKDGDGIPDIWEVEHGLDPLSDSFSVDSDGDSLSDFDEALRGSDPNDSNSTPIDTDLDGWFDFDEIQLRGTNHLDPFYLSPLSCDQTIFSWVSRPSASRLYEVEHNLTGEILAVNGSVKVGDSLSFKVQDVAWNIQYDSQDLWDVATLTNSSLNGCTMGVDSSSLPDRFRLSLVKNDLTAGMVPKGIRVAAGKSSVIRVQEMNATSGEALKWTVKRWLNSYPDLIPVTVTQALVDLGHTWSNADEWETDFIAYLNTHLVVHQHVAISPDSTLPVAMMEGVMAWVDGNDTGPAVLLGNSFSRLPMEGIVEMQSELEQKGSSLDLLLTHLTADLQLTLLNPYVNNALALYEEDANLTDIASVTHALVNMMQLDDGNTTKIDAYDKTAVYLSRLQFMVEPDLLANIDEGFLDMDGDFDSDILLNKDELMQGYDDVSSAQEVDTDGDGLTDVNDPCPVDASNNCLMNNDLFKDSDGDGVADYIDNCIHDPNPDQSDPDGNGFGGKCDYYTAAQIIRPATDMTIMAGEGVWLEAVELAYGTDVGIDEIQWDIDSNDEVFGFGPIWYSFPDPGTYVITFNVYDGSKNLNYTDYRTITVVQYNRSTPVAISDTYAVESAGTLNIGANAGVLANDRDADADTISAVLSSGPVQASNFVFNGDGSFTYEHNGVGSGTDTFTYRAFDGKVLSNEATVVIEVETQVVEPMTLEIVPVEHLFGSDEGTVTFTVYNRDTVEVTLPQSILRGAQADEFTIEADNCNDTILQVDENCTLAVRYPQTSGRSISAYLQVNEQSAFLHNYESIGEEAARRLPPVLYEINIPEEMNASTTYDISWSIVGYHQSYIAYVAFFDCSLAPEGECGVSYSQDARFDQALGLTPESTELADWSYQNVSALKSTYTYSFTPNGFTKETPIVIRFYYKSLIDDTAGERSISLIIPGNLSNDYYDTSGRKIQKIICPSGGCTQ